MATRDDIKAVIGYMKMAFPNYHPEMAGSPNTIDVMFDLLGDLPTEILLTAVKAACGEGGRQFAPSAGEIRGAGVKLHVKSAGIPTAGEAWNEVITFIRDHGCRETPHWSHEIVGKAADAMGMVNLGMSEDQMADRAHFMKIYDQLFARASEDACLPASVQGYIDERRQLVTHSIGLLADHLSGKE